MRRRWLVVLLVFAGGVAVAPPVAGSDPTVPSAAAPAASPPAPPPIPHVVAVVRKYPKRLWVIHERFTPWSAPSALQAHLIAAIEAAREGISLGGLEHRISCESGWEYNNEYAGHYGFGQYLPETWVRAVSTLGDRRVRLIRRKTIHQHVVIHTTLSDGSVHRTLGRRVSVRIVHVMEGRLPRYPGITHGWAQIRAMSESIAGRSAVSSSEWSCST